MFCRHARLGSIGIAVVVLSSCQKPELVTRVAVLRFENLTPDPSTEWIGRAVSEEIAGQLEGTRHSAVIPHAAIGELNARLGARPVNAPGTSAERAAAAAGGANRIVTGFYSVRGGKLTLNSFEENVATRHVAALPVEEGAVDDLLHMTDLAAHAVDEEAQPAITGSARALRAYALALEAQPEQRSGLLGEATSLDPDFGLPYLLQARDALKKGDGAEFERIFAEVRARGNGVRAVDRALLNLEQARLHAPLPARIDALSAVVRVMPADPFRLEELGSAELDANRYREAADRFQRLGVLLPGNPAPLNLLGYALLYAGDEAGAMKAFESYRKAAPDDANAWDSTGDAQFFFGHFSEAEKSYAAAKELLKVAWTRLIRGDRAAALLLVNQFRKASGADPVAALRAAPILRLAGNGAEAERLLGTIAAAPGGVGDRARAQLRWWNYLENGGAGVLASGNVSPNAVLTEALERLVKKDYQAAVPLWRKLASDTPPAEWWTRAVYARVLDATGQKAESARYARFTPIPRVTSAVSFDDLWFAWLRSHHASGRVE